MDIVPPLFVGCPIVLGAGGVGSCIVAVPPGTFVSVQAVIFGSPSCGGFVLSQSYNVIF